MRMKQSVQCASVSLAPCLAVARLRGLTAGSDPSRYYLYTPELQLMAETEQSTSTVKQIAYTYLWFGGQPAAQIENATSITRWYANDHLGTPYLQTDSTGAVVWRAEYTPYGDAFAYRAGATLHQPLRLPGQNTTDGNSLYYNVFRWYRAGWGRYTQSDPVGLKASINLFDYGRENPVHNFDPRGLACSRSCPECPSKTWVFYGAGLGFTVGIGSLSYGSSIGIMDAKCFGTSKTCTYFVQCSNLFGLGASAGVDASVGLAFNAPCSDDIGGISWGFDASVYDVAGGMGSFSSSPSGTVSVGGAGGLGMGGSGTFKLCDAHKLSCR
jgi:RHS repeat-associated protein